MSSAYTEFVPLSFYKNNLFPWTRKFPKAFWEWPWAQLEKGEAPALLAVVDVGHIESALELGWGGADDRSGEGESTGWTDSTGWKWGHLQQKGFWQVLMYSSPRIWGQNQIHHCTLDPSLHVMVLHRFSEGVKHSGELSRQAWCNLVWSCPENQGTSTLTATTEGTVTSA